MCAISKRSRVVSLRACADRLKEDGVPISIYSLRCLVARGVIPCLRVNRKMLIPYDEALNVLLAGGGANE